jgi:hypothetical protein
MDGLCGLRGRVLGGGARLRAKLWSTFYFLHHEDLSVAVNCDVVANGIQCQLEKTKRALCKKLTNNTKWTTRMI